MASIQSHYLQTSEQMLPSDMNATMSRLTKIERLAEEILQLRHELVEYDRKRNENRECLGAFRRGEIKQQNTKLWLSYGDQMIKLPRKNLLGLVEGDQVKINKLIDETRNEIKQKTKILLQENPDLTEMDPYVVKLLLSESKPKKAKKDEEDDDDDEEETFM